MKHLATIFCLAASLMSASPSAMAERVYLGVDVGRSYSSDACTGSLAMGVAGCSNKGVVVRIVTGYEFTENWSGEISYANYGTANLGTCVVTGPCGTAGLTGLGYWTLAGFQVSGVGTLPLDNTGFSLFGKLGMAATTVDIAVTSTNSYTLAGGFGGQYDVDRRYRIRTQYENLGTVGNAFTGKTKVTLLTAGLIMMF